MIKLALFDLDKTLLDDKSRLPEEFEEYRRSLEAEGVEVGVASARTIFSIAELFGDQMQYLTGICDNGNTIFRQGDSEVVNSWDAADIRQLISYIHKDPDLGLVFSGKEKYYADPDTVRRCSEHGRGWMPPLISDIEEAIAEDIVICNAHYVCFYEEYPSIMDCVEEKLAGPLKEAGDIWDLKEAGWGWIAVCPPGMGKAAGIRRLMKEMDLTRSEILVFGDSDNDISMFGETDFSYAMKNASPAAIEAAAYITEEDNNHNGALKAALTRAKMEKNR